MFNVITLPVLNCWFISMLFPENKEKMSDVHIVRRGDMFIRCSENKGNNFLEPPLGGLVAGMGK